jgi:hypothetical protein
MARPRESDVASIKCTVTEIKVTPVLDSMDGVTPSGMKDDPSRC